MSYPSCASYANNESLYGQLNIVATNELLLPTNESKRMPVLGNTPFDDINKSIPVPL